MKKVKLKVNSFSDDAIKKISDGLNISNISANILLNRGLDTFDKVFDYLNPDLEHLEDTDVYKDFDKGCQRIIKAIENKEKILIYGDYDVDGTTSISQFIMFLNRVGGIVDYYVPERESEGYGISQDFLNKISDMKIDVFITVDCGISEIESIDIINKLGIDTILIDHHQCGDIVPNAYALINPKQQGCQSVNKYLCASGLTFKFLMHLNRHFKIDDIEDVLLELACFGTIADIVDLIGDNRIITYNGLKAINSSKLVGVRKLIEKAGICDRKIEAFHVGYIIAPRINAAGRMDTARKAVQLFLSTDEEEAEHLAEELEELNTKRKEIEQSIFNEAVEIIEKNFLYKKHVIVVKGNDWHEGVIGIVSSRITEKYNRPSVVLSVKDKIAKGSSRSLEYLNIFEALTACSGLLTRFGGHKLAAGLTLDSDNVDNLSIEINKYADSIKDDVVAEKIVEVDSYINADDISMELYNELTMFEPFGHGNPKPTFAIKDFTIGGIRRVGKDKQHLSFIIESSKKKFRVIGFNKIGLLEKLLLNPKTIVATIDENEFRGNVDIQLILQDIEDFQFVKQNVNSDKSKLVYSVINKTKSKIMKTDIFDFAQSLSKMHKTIFTPSEILIMLKSEGNVECILKNDMLYIRK